MDASPAQTVPMMATTAAVRVFWFLKEGTGSSSGSISTIATFGGGRGGLGGGIPYATDKRPIPMSYSHRPRSSRGSKVLPTGLPLGIAQSVLSSYWDQVPPSARAAYSNSPAAAAAGEGFFASPGLGCDALVQVNAGGPGMLGRPGRLRCGSIPCRWAEYQLKQGGVVLGVRCCSEHVALIMNEPMWDLRPSSPDLFAVFEVMTG